MESILEKLYNGELHPGEGIRSVFEHYQSKREEAFESYESLMEKLPESLKEEFNEVMNRHVELIPLDYTQTFIDGFRLGALIMIEVYQKAA